MASTSQSIMTIVGSRTAVSLSTLSGHGTAICHSPIAVSRLAFVILCINCNNCYKPPLHKTVPRREQDMCFHSVVVPVQGM